MVDIKDKKVYLCHQNLIIFHQGVMMVVIYLAKLLQPKTYGIIYFAKKLGKKSANLKITTTFNIFLQFLFRFQQKCI